MKLKEILSGICVTKLCADPETEITGVECDSRKVKPGCLFVAVRGYETDGHKFIPQAIQNGAACVLCCDEQDGIPYCLTDNTRIGLAVTAANFYGRPADKMKIIGVTGTNGKTTTTNLIKTMLELDGHKVGLVGTNGNMIGADMLPTERTTPESNELQALFKTMYDAGCDTVVMEVSSHALYLDRVGGIEFEVGVFTNLTEDHLDFHKTMLEYGKAKAIMFTKCRHASINVDDEYADIMLKASTVKPLRYSCKDGDMTAKNLVLHADGVEFDLTYEEKTVRAKLAIPGKFSVYNAMSAISACVLCGVSLEKCAEYLALCHGVMGRAEVVPTGRDFTMLIDYAHTPDAMENIIKTVRGVAKGRVVTLFGCGGDRDSQKRPIMGKIAADLSDFVIVTTDNPRTEVPADIINDILAGMKDTKTPYIVIENRREAIGWAVENAQKDDVVILAGKGHETYQIIGKEKFHFDEREVIRDFLAK